MTYTREEREIVKNNIKMIENYCKTEIAPLIEGYSITADFSEIQYRKSDGSAFKKTSLFTVYKDGTAKFTSSALTIVLDENYKRTEFSVNAYENPQYMEDLLIRWQTVKAKLLNEIHNKNRMKSKVLNFTI